MPPGLAVGRLQTVGSTVAWLGAVEVHHTGSALCSLPAADSTDVVRACETAGPSQAPVREVADLPPVRFRTGHPLALRTGGSSMSTHRPTSSRSGYDPAPGSATAPPPRAPQGMDGTTAPVAAWIRAGLVGLPLYGVLTLWAAREPQPNPDEDYEAWARFVTAPEYVLTHVLGSGLGLIFVVFGTFALGAYLLRTRAARLALWAMTVAAFGQCLFLFFTGVSAFGAPLEGQAYLAGMNLDELPASTADDVQALVMLAAILASFVGNVLLGIAMWRSGALTVWPGALWILAALLMYPFGIILGALTTRATPPTVLVGAGLVTISGAWVVWRARRERAAADGRASAAQHAP